MTAWVLKIEYDGRGLVGWQRQRNGMSVQAVLESAAAHLCGGLPPSAVAAGRTDAGVHAAGQVVLMDLPDELAAHTIREALNFHMKPHAVVVLAAVASPDDDWNPRFSAIGRLYRYIILNRPARPTIESGYVWHVKSTLDEAAMHRAAQALVGHHDFTSFRASACQAASPVRTLDRLEVERKGEHIVIEASARSFLHHQVRNIVGTLRLVGDGHWAETRVADALAARDRSAAGPTAPPDGLTLMAVQYPEDPFSAQQ